MRIVRGPEEISITICACTYRRPAGLAALLEGLASQTFQQRDRPKLGIVIVDNEGNPQVEELCDQFKRRSNIDIRCVHEPRRGISHARNRCLDQIGDDCDFFAMIDDDEIPHPDWLEQLLEAQAHTDADVVEGRVIPVFPDGAPEWIVQGHHFGWHNALNKAHRTGQVRYPRLDEARTNNVLVRCAAVRKLGLRFDPRFGLSGGGDIVFFRAIRAAGYRIVYAPDACVRDIIPPERANLRFLCRRWFRVGSNARFKRPGRSRTRWQRCGGAAFSAGLARLVRSLLKGRTDLLHLAPGIKLLVHGLGQAASAVGMRYEQYRDADREGETRREPLRATDH